jgi:hypothetical protein
MWGGIDGFSHWSYSLPIHRHLVARANTEFVLIGLDRVRTCHASGQDLSLGAPGIFDWIEIDSSPWPAEVQTVNGYFESFESRSEALPAANKRAEISPKIIQKPSNNQPLLATEAL